MKVYQERFKEYPDYMAEETYAGVYFLKAAIERAGHNGHGKGDCCSGKRAACVGDARRLEDHEKRGPSGG